MQSPTQRPDARQIIEKWSKRRELARDVSEQTGRRLDVFAVHRWHQRNRIPAEYDAAIIAAAVKRGYSLSLIDLMHARSKHADQRGHDVVSFQGHNQKGVA